jgi:hypothetical protein
MPAVTLAAGRLAACRTLGSDGQIFGDDEQVLHRGEATKKQDQVATAETVKHEQSEGAGRGRRFPRPSSEIPARHARTVADGIGRRTRGVVSQQIQRYETGIHRIKVSQLQRLAAALAVSMTELLEAPRANSSEITGMIDTPIARRLMDAFQRLTSRERRCLAALAEEMAVRR